MSNFGRKSKMNLINVHLDLIKVAEQVVITFDHSIICGVRSEEDQSTAFKKKASKVEWPMSKHNVYSERPLAEAIDFLPYPFNGYPSRNDGIVKYSKDTARYYAISAAYIAVASSMGITLRGGFDWDGDGIFTDQSFDDIGHMEILV